ncbi:MAG: nucleotide-binding universal stress UspA family protein [Halobacteriales archaeon]|jgi:nucleotide-binding universal stress UspA family protein
MDESIFGRVVVPVANEGDARSTATALRPYVESAGGTAVAVHVVEKAGGAPDKASVEQREWNTVEMFEAFHRAFTESDCEVDTEILFGTDVAETVIEYAHEARATAVVYTPRGGGRWAKLLSGDVTEHLLTETDLPVVVLPEEAAALTDDETVANQPRKDEQ